MESPGIQEIKLGQERAVVVPLIIWKRLMILVEEMEDELIYDRLTAAPDEELIEHDDVCRILGLSPLRYLRTRAGMTQARLAEKTGISQSFIAKVENNRKKLSQGSKRKIASALKIKESELDY